MSDAFHAVNVPAKKLLDYPFTSPSESLRIPSVPFSIKPEITGQLNMILKSSREDELLSGILSGFFQLLDEAENRLGNLVAVKRVTREEIYRRLFLSEEFMRGRLSESVSIKQMAGAACLNPFHFLKLFKQLYQTTPHQFLTRLRLEKAYRDLEEGLTSVSGACYAAGFQSPASFSHPFKKRFGCPPSDLVK